MPLLFITLLTLILETLSVKAALAQSSGTSESASDTLMAHILYTNDMMGQLARGSSRPGEPGGMASATSRILQIGEQGFTIVLDAGNTLGPDPLAAFDQGETMIRLMRRAGYHGLIAANHEFNYGREALYRLKSISGIPFLCANIQGADSLFQPYRIFNAGGPTVGVIGLVSPDIAMRTNPQRLAGLTFRDPVAAAEETMRSLADSALTAVILLAHMREDEAMRLAREVEGVDLIVAGGYGSAGRPGNVPTSIRLDSGVRIVSTPGNGDFLGQVLLRFIPRPEGGYEMADVYETMLPLDASVPDDPESAVQVDRLKASYQTVSDKPVGRVQIDSPDDMPLLIAFLMQRKARGEIGVINRGALEIIDTDQPLRQGDINRLIRFPDRLVLMKLTGAQLRALTAQSGQQTRNSARLVFAGFDEKQMSVQSRPLRDEESYRVVTTEFLGNGGDGYRIFPQGKSIQRTGVDLRGLLASTIQENGVLSINILRSGAPGAWYAGWEAEGAFERNYIDNTTEQYRRQNESVSFLSGATTVAWSSSARLFVAHQRGVHEIRLDHAMDFGQIGQNFDNLKKSTDQITTDLKYRFLNRCGPFNPFISVGANTAFTENGDRPLLVRSSLGFQQQFFQRRVSVGFAGRTQRDFVVKTNDLGAEMTLDANQSFKSGARLRFQTKVFTGFTDRRVVSVENYNTLNVPLIGPIRLNIKQSNFIYRVTRIRGVAVSGVAFRTNLTVGFGYGLDWKWL